MRREFCFRVLQGCFGDLSFRKGGVLDEMGFGGLARSKLLGVDGYSSPAVFFHLGCSGGHCFGSVQVTCGRKIEEMIEMQKDMAKEDIYNCCGKSPLVTVLSTDMTMEEQ